MTSLVVVIGSGETTPTMVTTHQRVLAALGSAPHAVVLDTPYGFQENADEISARTLHYLDHNVGAAAEVVSLRDADGLTPVREADLLARVEAADWVFAGPGSPTYLVRQLARTRLPEALRRRLGRPGASVFASAAACTLGRVCIPVYEIYKAGEPPHWHDGLDLLSAVGLDAVVIPHYDNTEGGTHDTRYCYLGARRLAAMEAALPSDTWVLGVDEHTALLLDLTTGVARVEGRGGATVRARDVEVAFPAGSELGIDRLVEAARGRPDTAPAPAAAAGPAGEPAPAVAPPDGSPPVTTTSPLLEEVGACAARFDTALAAGAALDAAEATVALAQLVTDWSADTFQSSELDRARQELHRQVTALARAAEAGLHAHRDLVAPHVEMLLELRDRARREGRFADADRIRAALREGGVEVRDGADGTDWWYHDPVDLVTDPGSGPA